jgi:hypothetical protein
MTTPKEVAEWMLAQLDGDNELLQVDAVTEIERLFGPEFVQVGATGEVGIHPRVLYQFRKLSEDEVVWVTKHGMGYGPEDYWRRRCDGDSSGRTQYLY